eukprot:CAMPEP_0194368486 /NCGR_PEP_ID=MMETSP0174-20130528/16732_1 /TAXON_ID=216777 /ORGANISM="Proboscia alata, Strain PI-D3" /LENGTH=672 /DNA_ID=CAMNT_0039144891 /DNA_START=263 /DNA_END=2281 /DNA_ORIENTATION=+
MNDCEIPFPKDDPFPMRSVQAAEMLESTTSNTKTGDNDTSLDYDHWNSMDMKTKAPNNRNVNPRTQLTSRSASMITQQDDDEYNDIGTERNDEDPFFDRAQHNLYNHMDNSRSSYNNRPSATSRFIHFVFKRLYGDIPLSEIRRVFLLSLTFFFMIGGYWLLRSLKDPVITALCGVSVIPRAKMLSVVVVLGVVSGYNYLLSLPHIPKHHLFYFFGTIYFGIFCTIAILLQHPTMGLPNEVSDPSRLLGWISYCAIESFGSVMISLFWSFANSVVSLETAKNCFGFVIAIGQVGSILGPTIVSTAAETRGVPFCYFCGAVCMLLLQATMMIYVRWYGVDKPMDPDLTKHAANLAMQAKEEAAKKKSNKAGVLEGLVLFYKHNYIKGLFAISCLFMVEVTIVDYTMKLLAKEHFDALHPCKPGMSCWNVDADTGVIHHGLSQEATQAFTRFMGIFGQATNTLSFLLSLLGTSAVIRTLGVRLTLLLFPSLCLAIILLVRTSPTLWMVFGAMILLKANSYALNNPTKEILYQPTSPAVRYKAKSWIDIFGARGSKALGSLVTNAFSHSASELVANGSLVGIAVSTFLIWNANFMGRTFDEYTERKFILGADDDEDSGGEMEMEVDAAIHQNDDDEVDEDDFEGGTSCALEEVLEDKEEEDSDCKVANEAMVILL